MADTESIDRLMDALDDYVSAAIAEARPEANVHEAVQLGNRRSDLHTALERALR